MRKKKPVRRTRNRRPDRVEAEEQPTSWEQEDFQKSSAGTYSYSTWTVIHDPKTGRRVPASVGIVVSPGSVMMWLKT